MTWDDVFRGFFSLDGRGVSTLRLVDGGGVTGSEGARFLLGVLVAMYEGDELGSVESSV